MEDYLRIAKESPKNSNPEVDHYHVLMRECQHTLATKKAQLSQKQINEIRTTKHRCGHILELLEEEAYA